jgi:hypothetical protein
MKHIGQYNITKTDGSVNYTLLDIFKGETTVDSVVIKTIETAFHNGGTTIRETTKEYPLTVLDAFTGGYDAINDKPIIDMTVLGGILQTFGITLQQ